MGGQRRGESGSDVGRGRNRGRRLAFLLLAGTIALGACDAGRRIIGLGTTGGTGGTGGTGSGSGSGALVGTWRNVSTLVLSSGQTVVFDVRWTFDASGGCSRTRIETVVTGNTGSETTETLPCTYSVSGSTVTVTFQGSSVPSQFSFAFAGSDLLLAGTRFTRLA